MTIRYYYSIGADDDNIIFTMIDSTNRIIVPMSFPHLSDTIQEYLVERYPDYKVRTCQLLDCNKVVYLQKYFMNLDGETEWFGWNSKMHDLFVLSTLFAYVAHHQQMPDSKKVITWSENVTLKGQRYPAYFFNEVTKTDKEIVPSAREIYRHIVQTARHVDVGALNEKSGEKIDETLNNTLSYSLGRIAAYSGRTIPKDILFIRNSKMSLNDLLKYAVERSIIISEICETEPEYINGLSIRDAFRETFPFITEKSRNVVRDATMTKYASNIILGEEYIKPIDWETIRFNWPFSHGSENLIDYIEQNEKHINPRVLSFYRYLQGKNTQTWEQYFQVKEHTITGTTTISVPYLKADGSASCCFTTPSFGGNHGGILIGAEGKRPDKDKGWFRNFENIEPKSVTATVDIDDLIYVDFTMYYATLNSKLGVFRTGDTDNLEKMMHERKRLQSLLTKELKDEDPETYALYDKKQSMTKVTIASSTGGSNQHLPPEKTELPLDNATLSMRSIGNLLIYVLGQRFSDEGGIIVFTNTDGICVANMDMSQSLSITKRFCTEYGIDVEPEHLERIISRSTNERIEFKDGKVNKAGGKISRSLGNRIPLDAKIDYPRVCGIVALEYMSEKGWMLEEINIQKVRDLIERYYQAFIPMDWTVTFKGHRTREYFFDGAFEGEVNRVVLTKEGERIIMSVNNIVEKIPGMTTDCVTRVNTEELLNSKSYWNIIDIEAYIIWTMDILRLWHNPAYIEALDGKTELLDLDDIYT